MRLGLISDVHGNSPALAAVFAALWGEVDQVIFLGDICGYYPFVNECMALWDGARIVSVRGNHDHILLECLRQHIAPPAAYQARHGSALSRALRSLDPAAAALMQSWPTTRRLVVDGATLVLYHGAPWDPLEGRVYPDYSDWARFADVPGDIILLGNTHYPFHRRYHDKLIVNPGSVGQPRDRSDGACCALLDVANRTVQQRRVPFDCRRLIDDAAQHDPTVPYLVEVLHR